MQRIFSKNYNLFVDDKDYKMSFFLKFNHTKSERVYRQETFYRRRYTIQGLIIISLLLMIHKQLFSSHIYSESKQSYNILIILSLFINIIIIVAMNLKSSFSIIRILILFTSMYHYINIICSYSYDSFIILFNVVLFITNVTVLPIWYYHAIFNGITIMVFGYLIDKWQLPIKSLRNSQEVVQDLFLSNFIFIFFGAFLEKNQREEWVLLSSFRRSERIFRSLFENYPCIQFILDKNGKILQFNKKGLEILQKQIDPENIQNIIDLFDEQHHQQILQLLTSEEVKTQQQLILQAKDSQIYQSKEMCQIVTKFIPFKKGQEILFIMNDVTLVMNKQQIFNNFLQELSDDIEKINNNLEIKYKLIDNNLKENSIENYNTNTLMDISSLNNKIKSAVEVTRILCKGISNNKMYDFNIRELIIQIIENQFQKLKQQQIGFTIKFESSLPKTVFGDMYKFKVILINILQFSIENSIQNTTIETKCNLKSVLNNNEGYLIGFFINFQAQDNFEEYILETHTVNIENILSSKIQQALQNVLNSLITEINGTITVNELNKNNYELLLEVPFYMINHEFYDKSNTTLKMTINDMNLTQSRINITNDEIRWNVNGQQSSSNNNRISKTQNNSNNASLSSTKHFVDCKEINSAKKKPQNNQLRNKKMQDQLNQYNKVNKELRIEPQNLKTRLQDKNSQSTKNNTQIESKPPEIKIINNQNIDNKPEYISQKSLVQIDNESLQFIKRQAKQKKSLSPTKIGQLNIQKLSESPIKKKSIQLNVGIMQNITQQTENQIQIIQKQKSIEELVQQEKLPIQQIQNIQYQEANYVEQSSSFLSNESPGYAQRKYSKTSSYSGSKKLSPQLSLKRKSVDSMCLQGKPPLPEGHQTSQKGPESNKNDGRSFSVELPEVIVQQNLNTLDTYLRNVVKEILEESKSSQQNNTEELKIKQIPQSVRNIQTYNIFESPIYSEDSDSDEHDIGLSDENLFVRMKSKNLLFLDDISLKEIISNESQQQQQIRKIHSSKNIDTEVMLDKYIQQELIKKKSKSYLNSEYYFKSKQNDNLLSLDDYARITQKLKAERIPMSPYLNKSLRKILPLDGQAKTKYTKMNRFRFPDIKEEEEDYQEFGNKQHEHEHENENQYQIRVDQWSQSTQNQSEQKWLEVNQLKEDLNFVVPTHEQILPFKCLSNQQLMDFLEQRIQTSRRKWLPHDILIQEKFGYPEIFTILAVDDNAVSIEYIENLKTEYKFQVERAIDGAQAVKLFRKMARAGLLYHLILMDIIMPVMDGYDSTESIRELEIKFNAPKSYIVALTTECTKKTEKKCFAVGMDEYIEKPLKAQKLNGIITKRLRDLNLQSYNAK